ncbi:uncharacterized protein LOC131248384 [Magnolia sinica]|uniref:uncharacterized protein LOC131248384 n=1 Tax=Magnolia sinica TaxID=86752 RepID=UPI0026583ADF|nr:uncharacterized protein LOC131248384 [Magnolia sinica]
MAWSAENATRAYLQTMKMGKRPKQLDVSEFASALAAGNNAQLMVEACSGTAGPTTLALVAAAHQTGGRVVCILRGPDELCSSKKALGTVANHIEFVVGDAQILLLNDYAVADFMLIDCNMVDHEAVLRSVQVGAKDHGAVVMGYNAFNKGSCSGSRTVLLPIGGGLQVTRIQAGGQIRGGGARKSRWVVRVDQCTGEEHVFRVIPSHRKELRA